MARIVSGTSFATEEVESSEVRKNRLTKLSFFGRTRHLDRLCMMLRLRSPLFSLAILFLFASTSSALHFYLDLNEKRCFIEELPTDTVVEGVLYSLQIPTLYPGLRTDRTLQSARMA